MEKLSWLLGLFERLSGATSDRDPAYGGSVGGPARSGPATDESVPDPVAEPTLMPVERAGTRETPRTAARIVGVSTLLVALLSLSVLSGWLLDIRVLKSTLPVLTTMKANTAVCLGLLALGLWLSRTPVSHRQNRLWLWIALAVVALTAGATLCEYAFHWDAAIDQLLFADPEHTGASYPPGRMAPATATCFLFLSGALFFTDTWKTVSHALALLTALVLTVSLIGYLYDLPTLYGAARYSSLALHTIFGFLLLCTGVFASRPKRGLTALITGSQAETSNVRPLLAGAVLLPIVVGLFTLQGQRLGWYGSEFGLALFSVLLMVLTVSLTWATEQERQSVEAKRLQAEQALRDSEEQFRTLANSIPNLVWMAEANGEITWYNRRWYEYTGTTAQQMSGSGWQSVHDASLLPTILERWKATLDSGEPFEMVFPLRGADGRFRPFLTRIEPVRDARGRIVRWFGTNTDISTQEESREALARTNVELRRVNADLEQFAFSASHDLQEPLRMVCICSQMLAERYRDQLNDDARRYLDFAITGAQRMERLLHDLLAYTQVLTSKGHALAPVRSSDVLKRAIENLRGAIEETGALVKSQPLPVLLVEEVHLLQIFQNVIGNAIKYCRNGPPVVEISAEREQSQWRFCVRDNGIGIDLKYQQQVFGLFKRLHNNNDYQGTGIGLAMCRKIVERYGGRIWIESEGEGRGCAFNFTLPGVEFS